MHKSPSYSVARQDQFASSVSRSSVALSARLLVLMGVLLSAPALAQSPAKLDECRRIQNNAERLSCYDRLPGTAPAPTGADLAIKKPEPPVDVQDVPDARMDSAGPLSQRWETERTSKQGTWTFRPHKPTYFLIGRYTDKVNYRPYDTYFSAVNDPRIGLNDTESKFQLSFKLKAAEDLFERGIDLWFGYTQQNQWQVYNKNISAPFRETNYEPEAFVTIPTVYSVAGLRGRFVNLGFVHQSNGQSNILSRSWNRIYAQAGFDYGDNFALTLKPWYRLPEKAKDDDNPHITKYLGNFEAVASYRLNTHMLSLLGRSSFEMKKGFAQFDWSFPLQGKLKGYLQLTTGYGESLIDYNHQQNTVGLGILLVDWM